MTRLLLVEALRRYGAGLALVMLGGGWMWRSLPPWVIRDAWWRLSVGARIGWLVVALVGYVALTAPIVRLLLRSRRLEYWRQFPIPPSQWASLQRGHLLALHVPAAIALAYLLAPAGVIASASAIAVGSALLVGSGRFVARLDGRRRVSSRFSSRTLVRGRGLALARVLGLALRRQQAMHLRAVVVAQVGLLGFAILGVSHVASVEPDAGPPLVRTLAVVAAMAVSSAILVAVRAVDRDRWFLDTLSVAPAPELSARLVLGIVVGVPTILGTAIAAAPLGPAQALWGLGLGASATAWGASFGSRIAAGAEARRDLHRSRPAVFVLRFAYGLALVHVVGPVALVIAALAEAALARRSLIDAAATRARLQTTTVEDDHG